MPEMKNQTVRGSHAANVSAVEAALRDLCGKSRSGAHTARTASAAMPSASSGKLMLYALLAATLPAGVAAASVTTNATLVQIGVAALQQTNDTINGSGVVVGQAEASAGYYNPPGNPYAYLSVFEPNPTGLGQAASKFTYTDYSTPTTYSSGQYSGHAQYVASLFYGNTGSGVAPGVAGVDVYESDYYYNNVISGFGPPAGSNSAGQPTAASPAVVNQSFIWEGASATAISDYNYVYNTNAALYNTLFVSAAGDGTTTGTTPASYVNPPATAQNGISVGALGLPNVTGVDITAPGGATSFTAPLVSGVATDLVQAGREDIGGPGTSASATDIRVIKALILNGATKPVGWTNTPTSPLDQQYGAGVVNAYNSYENLAGGAHGASATTTQAAGSSPQFVLAKSAIENSLIGWNLATLTSSASQAAVDHYNFSLPQLGNNRYNLTATLDWNVQAYQSSMNHLDLYLLNSNGTVAESISPVDNVQQLVVNGLLPGNYDLAVLKQGGAFVTPSEVYALAWAIHDPAGTTPEPGMLSLIAVGLLGLLSKRRPLVKAAGV